MEESAEELIADFAFLALLKHLSVHMTDNHIEDMTQTNDEFVLRNLAKCNCFSVYDVLDELNELQSKLGICI